MRIEHMQHNHCHPCSSFGGGLSVADLFDKWSMGLRGPQVPPHAKNAPRDPPARGEEEEVHGAEAS